jgi:hypothetical protein
VYPFEGEAARKIDMLARLEELFTVVEACRAAGVYRHEFKLWVATDPVFHEAVLEANDCCVQRVESVMYLASTTLDAKGKVQLTACFGLLNTKADDWGLAKSQFIQRQNAKLIDECARIISAEVPPEAADRIRARLDTLRDRASRLPPGASLK